MKKQRLVVGISGSSGAILGIRLLEILRATPIETHLVVTPSARLTIELETSWKLPDVLDLASAHYSHRDTAAPIASGSFETLGMVVIPCSVKSLSAVANCYSTDLLSRAADVTLKEGRPLILVFREAPLHAGHIRLMEQAAHAGAVLFPPVPAFYTHPQVVDEIVDNIVGRVLRRMGIENDLYMQWQGIQPAGEAEQKKAKNVNVEDLWNLPALTLATSGADGTPSAAAIYFASATNHTLYFFSAEDSQHSINLAADPRAAASIHPLVEGWLEIHGLQLRGRVQLVSLGKEWDQAWDLYQAKFPFAAELKDIIAKNRLYAFRPEWVRLIDNRKGFGYKEEWTSQEE
jgi:4-hydroxy-3-polyprenylbenzoate decarboxylase